MKTLNNIIPKRQVNFSIITQFITKKQLLEIVPFSHTHVLRLEYEGKFPRRIKPYGGRNGKAFWVLEEIEDWIQSQIALRDNSTNASS